MNRSFVGAALRAAVISVAVVSPCVASAQQPLQGDGILLTTVQVGAATLVIQGVTFGPAISGGQRWEFARFAVFGELDAALGVVGPIGALRLGVELGAHYIVDDGRPVAYFVGGGLAGSVQGSDREYWTGTDNPTAVVGGGFEPRLSGGVELLRDKPYTRLIGQAELMVPTYLLKEEGGGRKAWAPALVISFGGAWLPLR